MAAPEQTETQERKTVWIWAELLFSLITQDIPMKRNKKGDWLARRQGFKGKGSGAKEDPSPASIFII